MALFDFSLPASDPNNPNGVTTNAADLQQRQLLAQALMKQGADYSPVQSPWQGAARLANALVGGLQQDQLNAQQSAGQKAGNADFAKYLSGFGLGGQAQAGPTAASLAAGLDGSPGSSNSSLPTFAQIGQPSADLSGVLNSAAAKYGQDPNTLTQIAGIESHFDPNAKNPNSSASGLMQFTRGTAAQYGVTNPFDPVQSADAGAHLLADNNAGLTQALGRPPTPGELYLAHQQGLGGAIKLLSNPNAPAGSVVGNAAVALNGGNPNMTAGQFAKLWTSRLDGNSAQPSAPPVQVASTGSLSGLGGVSSPSLSYAAPQSAASAAAAITNNGQSAAGGPAISVPGYSGTFTRAQAAAAQEGDNTTPGTDEWDAANAAQKGGQPQANGAPSPASAVSSAAARPVSPQAVPGAPTRPNVDVDTALRILNNPYASPAAKQVVAATLQQALKPQETWQSFQDKDGSWWQQNSVTGERKLVQDNSPSEDAFSVTTNAAGQQQAFNKRTGDFGTPQGQPAAYRPMTPQEKQAYGVPMDQPAYVGPDGKPSGIGGGTTVNVGKDATTYDQQLAEGLGKAHAALANGVEDAQARARDIAAMQGAVDAIQRAGGTTGFAAPQKLQLQKAINAGANALGIQEPYDVSDPEFLTKFNRQIAGQQAKGSMGARVTNFEMKNYLSANPGLEMSTTGNQRLLGIQAQIEQRNIEVGNAIRNATAQAISNGQKINPVQVQKIITDYDTAHHIADPVTGQDLTENFALPEFQSGTNAPMAVGHQTIINGIRVKRVN